MLMILQESLNGVHTFTIVNSKDFPPDVKVMISRVHFNDLTRIPNTCNQNSWHNGDLMDLAGFDNGTMYFQPEIFGEKKF